MSDLVVAIGLVMVIEGLLWAAAPQLGLKLLAAAEHMPERTLRTAGTVAVAAGFVIVCPNWYYARAGASGEFRLPDLPRGTYVVHAWHPQLGSTQRTIQATGRDPVTLDLRL